MAAPVLSSERATGRYVIGTRLGQLVAKGEIPRRNGDWAVGVPHGHPSSDRLLKASPTLGRQAHDHEVTGQNATW